MAMTEDVREVPAKARRGLRGPYRLSKRLEVALEAIASGKVTSVSEAAQVSGMTARNVQYALHKPHVRDWLRSRVAALLSLGQTAAAETMLSLLRSENSMTQFRASQWLLGVAGFAPPPPSGAAVNLSVDVTVKAGYVVDLSEPGEPLPRPAVIDVEPVRAPAAEPVQPIVDWNARRDPHRYDLPELKPVSGVRRLPATPGRG